MPKFLDEQGVSFLWSQLSLQDYPNNDTLVAVINAIDETKANKNELDKYLTKEEYVVGETGGTINLSSMFYPVGSIYLSVTPTDPGILFGFGQWEQIEDVFLLAAGSSYPGGITGGEATHTLTINEIPAHGHDFNRHQLWRDEEVPVSGLSDGYGVNNKTLDIYRDTSFETGGTQPHNNMPPYLTVYMWKRTA